VALIAVSLFQIYSAVSKIVSSAALRVQPADPGPPPALGCDLRGLQLSPAA